MTEEGLDYGISAGTICGDPDHALEQCRRWESAGADQLSFGGGTLSREQTGEREQQSCLAGSVRTEDGVNGARVDRQVEAPKDRQRAPTAAEIVAHESCAHVAADSPWRLPRYASARP